MWMTLASSLQGFASAAAEDAAKVAQEAASDATPPDAIPGFDRKLPTPEEFLEMLDTMTGITEEEKATLREDLLKNIRDHGFPSNPAADNDITMQTMVLLSLLGIVALIFVFFVYKLFKCLTEREMKREEKKNKQLKKKK